MRITSILRTGALALALMAAGSAVGPAFAAPANNAPAQQSQLSNSGPYDGAADEAAKHSYK